MRLSQFFLPTLKETPAEAAVISHQLMLRAGMIHQTSSGIYAWLPLGLRVLDKVIAIIDKEQAEIGAHKTILPTIQSADLWKKSGRYEGYGKEMLRMQDRHDRDMLYSPTAEEVVTEIFKHHVKSYKQLPQMLYQIHWKFRDEIRPRFGVMRGREFLMKDGYSFDLSYEDAKKTYKRVYESYLRIFDAMDLKAIPVKADTGPIGGDLSHEFHVVAQSGESALYYDKQFDACHKNEHHFDHLSQLYAAADDMHQEDTCPISKDALVHARGIEIGHIFNFGTKYSKSLDAGVVGRDGDVIYPEMGSYGIGVGRLVAALIEVHHDDQGIIWPASVAPFHVGILNMKPKDDACHALCCEIYAELMQGGFETLYDDRDERAGKKFADMDLIGVPYHIVVGNAALKEDIFEIKHRASGARTSLKKSELINFFKNAKK